MSARNRRPIGFAAPWLPPALERAPTLEAAAADASRPVWRLIAGGVRLGLMDAWRFARSGWFAALLLVVLTAPRLLELRDLGPRHVELQRRHDALLIENLVLAGNHVAPRPVRGVADLLWFFQTVPGEHLLASRSLTGEDRRLFLENLRRVPGSGGRFYSTTTSAGVTWIVRIGDAVTLETATGVENTPPPSQ